MAELTIYSNVQFTAVTFDLCVRLTCVCVQPTYHVYRKLDHFQKFYYSCMLRDTNVFCILKCSCFITYSAKCFIRGILNAAIFSYVISSEKPHYSENAK